jgi:hypothetical protein
MKYKGLIFFFVTNEVAAVSVNAMSTGQRPPAHLMAEGLSTLAFCLILALFAWLGFFTGLKFRHWLLIIILVVLALAGGFWYGSLGNR